MKKLYFSVIFSFLCVNTSMNASFSQRDLSKTFVKTMCAGVAFGAGKKVGEEIVGYTAGGDVSRSQKAQRFAIETGVKLMKNPEIGRAATNIIASGVEEGIGRVLPFGRTKPEELPIVFPVSIKSDNPVHKFWEDVAVGVVTNPEVQRAATKIVGEGVQKGIDNSIAGIVPSLGRVVGESCRSKITDSWKIN